MDAGRLRHRHPGRHADPQGRPRDCRHPGRVRRTRHRDRAWLRAQYFAPIVTRSLNVPSSVWIVSQDWTTKVARWLASRCSIRSSRAHQGRSPGKKVGGRTCTPSLPWQYLVQHGYTQVTSYQPATQFWAFQWIEAGWLLGVSVLLIAVTCGWSVGGRPADCQSATAPVCGSPRRPRVAQITGTGASVSEATGAAR